MKRRNVLIGLGSTAAVLAALGSHWRNKPTLPAVDVNVIGAKHLSAVASLDAVDVCIIGSGPAGCALAKPLLAAGHSVVMLESGANLADVELAQKTMALDVYRNSGPLDYPLQPSRVRAIGGTSNIWTGRTPRLLPSDFASGFAARVGNWPLQYSDLQSYYDAAELALNVHGDKLIAGHAPRTRDLPFRADNLDELKKVLAPTAVKLNAPPLSLGGDGKQPVRTANDWLPMLINEPRFTLVQNATVTKIHCTSVGDVDYLDVRSVAGDVQAVRAKHYVVAAGALESVRLLLLSANDVFPQGLGNHHDQLGRYFMEHPFFSWNGRLGDEDDAPIFSRWQLGRTLQYVDALHAEGVGGVILGIYGMPPNAVKIAVGIEMAPSADNRITLDAKRRDLFDNPGLDLHFAFSELDQQLRARGASLARDLFTQIGIKKIEEESAIHWSHHHLGGARMANSPEQGVVDANLRVFGTNNLYVASSAVFRTGGVANPTLTIVALSLRLAEHLQRTLAA